MAKLNIKYFVYLFALLFFSNSSFAVTQVDQKAQFLDKSYRCFRSDCTPELELMLVDGGKWIDNEVVSAIILNYNHDDPYYNSRNTDSNSIKYKLTKRVFDKLFTTSVNKDGLIQFIGMLPVLDVAYVQLFENIGIDVSQYFAFDGYKTTHLEHSKVELTSAPYYQIFPDQAHASDSSLLEHAFTNLNFPLVQYLMSKPSAKLGNEKSNIFYRAMNYSYYGIFNSGYGRLNFDYPDVVDSIFKVIGSIPQAVLSTEQTRYAFMYAILNRKIYFAQKLLEAGFRPGQGSFPIGEATLFSLYVVRSKERNDSYKLYEYLSKPNGNSDGQITDYDNVEQTADLMLFVLKNKLYQPSEVESIGVKASVAKLLQYFDKNWPLPEDLITKLNEIKTLL